MLYIFIGVFILCISIALIKWMIRYVRAHEAKINARPVRYTITPPTAHKKSPAPTKHNHLLAQRVFESFEGRPVLSENLLAVLPQPSAWSMISTSRNSLRTLHEQDTPRGSIFFALENTGSNSRRIAVCAPRPPHIPSGLEHHDNTFSWRETSWDAYYRYNSRLQSEIGRKPDVLRTIYPDALAAWEAIQQQFRAYHPKPFIYSFSISLFKNHMVVACSLEDNKDADLAQLIEFSKAMLSSMLEFVSSDLWHNEQVQTQEDFMIHLAEHIEEHNKKIIEYIVVDCFDDKRVSSQTRDCIVEIARMRDDKGEPTLLHEIRKRWDKHANDGLTMVDAPGAQGGLTAISSQGGLSTSPKKR